MVGGKWPAFGATACAARRPVSPRKALASNLRVILPSLAWGRRVVVAPPSLQHRSCARQGPQHGLVLQFVAQPAIERRSIEACRGDVAPAHTAVVGPGQAGVAGQLRAVVADDGVGRPNTLGDDGVQRARAFVDDCQGPEAAVVDHRVGLEVQARRELGASGTARGRSVPIARLSASDVYGRGLPGKRRSPAADKPCLAHQRRLDAMPYR